MKQLFLVSLLACLTFHSFSQDHSGTYGYTLKLEGTQPPKAKSAIPGGTLVLQKMEGNKYRFWLDVLNGPPGYNRGETDGTIILVNDTASFENTFEGAIVPCILKFKKSGNTINIYGFSSSYNCGFGNGVSAEADYAWLKTQPPLNNDWLKKEYPESPIAIADKDKIEVFQDENCKQSFTPKVFFPKGENFLSIADAESSIYTEHYSSSGKFTWGWIRKSGIKLLSLPPK
ncbi:MAG TPA: hypothetical protein VMZ03_14125 [Chitinophagaceae bacterium]|nr:hypothetical protein [Chitinophagaceae bacterium]